MLSTIIYLLAAAPEKIHKFSYVIESMKKKKKGQECYQALPADDSPDGGTGKARRRRRGDSCQPHGQDEAADGEQLDADADQKGWNSDDGMTGSIMSEQS